MHRLVAFLSLSLLLAGCAGLSPTPLPPDDLMLQKVHVVDQNKHEIYTKSLEWMAKAFGDSKTVIRYQDDKEESKIIGKGITEFSVEMLSIGVPIKCEFTMEIEIKDGRFRNTYSNFARVYNGKSTPLTDKKQVDQVRAKLNELDEQLVLAVLQKNKDW